MLAAKTLSILNHFNVIYYISNTIITQLLRDCEFLSFKGHQSLSGESLPYPCAGIEMSKSIRSHNTDACSISYM